MSKNRGSIFPGLILILIGLILVMKRMNYDMDIFQWEILIPLFGILIGLKMWVTALTTSNKGKVFPGTLILVLSGFYFAWNYGIMDDYYYLDTIWPIFPTALGLSFLALFLVNFRNWLSLFPAILFLGIGLSFFAVSMDLVEYWVIEDFWYNMEDYLYDIKDWYPVLIILFGFLIIFTSIRRSSRRKDS